MDEKIDKDGLVHEKGWDGQYKPKENIFGPVKDINIWGQPKIERDIFGNPKVERTWWGDPIRSKSGETLYKRSGGSSEGTGSGGCEVALVGIIFAAIGFLFYLLFKLIKFVFTSTIRGFQALNEEEYSKAVLYFSVPVIAAVLILLGVVYWGPYIQTVRGMQNANRKPIENLAVVIKSPDAKIVVPIPETMSPTPVRQSTSNQTINPPPAQQNQRKLIVVAKSVNLRAGPGTDNKVVGYAYSGDKFTYYGESADRKWIQIDPSGSTWIATSLVEYVNELVEESKPSNMISTGYMIIVGAFGHYDKAERWETRFNDAGYQTMVFFREGNYRVVIPGYSTEEEALTALDRIKNNLNESAYMVGMPNWCPNRVQSADWVECK